MPVLQSKIKASDCITHGPYGQVSLVSRSNYITWERELSSWRCRHIQRIIMKIMRLHQQDNLFNLSFPPSV